MEAAASGRPDTVENWPAIITWDLEAAFPSVSQEWMHMTLAARGAPEGIAAFVEGIYRQATAYGRAGNETHELFRQTSGVAQGCPGSGWIFAAVLDPALKLLAHALGQEGVLTACADDMAAAIKQLKALPALADAFEVVRRSSGLKLKPAKCHIIPMRKMGKGDAAKLKDWLRINIPAWVNFNIDEKATLLGFSVGPKGGECSWDIPMSKWKLRARSIAATGVAARLATHMYNGRATSTLSYIAQVSPAPAKLAAAQRATIYSLLHMP